jgi:catechol 2,3-dioxygenase-like lactoylglutathione lyase family enzyme
MGRPSVRAHARKGKAAKRPRSEPQTSRAHRVGEVPTHSRPQTRAAIVDGMAGAIEIRGIDHVVLRVSDMRRSLHFYCGVLGCREERRIDALGLVQLRAGAALIDLVDVAGPLGRIGGGPPGDAQRNMDHVALQLAAFDEAALRAELLGAGIEPGEVGQRYGAEGMGPSMYIRDPDGNVVELKGPGKSTPDANRSA